MEAIAAIAQMVREAEAHAETMSKDRIRAEEYYRGEMKDLTVRANHSKMVKPVVREHIKKVLPSLVRTILGSDRVVEYLPAGPDDEAMAEQATNYVNIVCIADAGIYRTIENAIHDALKLRNGIVKWWWDERTDVKISKHTGLDDAAFGALAGDDSVEVLEHSERAEITDAGPMTVHDLKIRRKVPRGVLRTSAVSRENFLIHPDAISLQDSSIVGEVCKMTRSDLVAMGHDRGLVDGLPTADGDDAEAMARRDSAGGSREAHAANEQIDYYDLYVRFDKDDDGIAELRHMVFAGGLTEANLLIDEECDDIQLCDIKVMANAHQWEGISLHDDLNDLQRAQTSIFRETLDNIYWINKAQPIIQEGVIVDEGAVYNPEFGLPITVRRGTDVRAAVGYDPKPFVAGTSFQMMEYLDGEASDRTGISDASSGLAPDALQNMTAKGAAMIEQSGIGQTELMARTIAEGLRVFFRGILRLTIRHQDKARTVRMAGEWVDIDPRHWNADMDCVVNTGLGSGTRERDMAAMQMVMGLHAQTFQAFGTDNPFVTPEQAYNAMSRFIEAAGLKTPDMYLTKPDPAEMKAKMEAAAQQPSPDQVKAQAQMQIEQVKVQAQGQLKQMELAADMQMADKDKEVQANKELAQLEADKAIEAERRATDIQLKQMDIDWQREKLVIEQSAALAPAGMAMDETGQPVNPTMDLMKQTQALLMLVSQQIANNSGPKRVVRDAMGEVIGLETMKVN